MNTMVRCPFCGEIFYVNRYMSRRERLKEIVDFIKKNKPTVEQCIAWIIKRYGVRRVKALEYIRDLAETREITAEGMRLTVTV